MFRMFSPVINATFEGSTGIYGHHELAGCTVFCRYVGTQFFFCYLAKVSYYKRFSASHKLSDCDFTTNAKTLFSAPQIQKTLAFINIVFLE